MLFTTLARLSTITATALVLALPVTANFHIFNCNHQYTYGSESGGYHTAVPVPSNEYNCNGLLNNVYGASSVDSEKTFFAAWDLCGVSELNFYPNGNTIPFYIGGGNGTIVGTCYKGGGGTMSCSASNENLSCTDDWICYSSICGQ